MGKYWGILKESIGIKRVLIFGAVGVIGGSQQWLLSKGYAWAGLVPSYAIWIIVPLALSLWWVLEYAVSLKEKLKPNFVLSLPHGGISHTPERKVISVGTTGILNEYKAIYVRFCVEPVSESNVEDCTAELVSVLKRDSDGQFHETGFIDPIQLLWSHSGGAKQKTLKPKVKNYVGILKVRGDTENGFINPEFEVPVPLKIKDIFEDCTTYRLEVVVNGGGRSKSIVIDVARGFPWDNITAEEMKEDG